MSLIVEPGLVRRGQHLQLSLGFGHFALYSSNLLAASLRLPVFDQLLGDNANHGRAEKNDESNAKRKHHYHRAIVWAAPMV